MKPLKTREASRRRRVTPFANTRRELEKTKERKTTERINNELVHGVLLRCKRLIKVALVAAFVADLYPSVLIFVKNSSHESSP